MVRYIFINFNDVVQCYCDENLQYSLIMKLHMVDGVICYYNAEQWPLCEATFLCMKSAVEIKMWWSVEARCCSSGSVHHGLSEHITFSVSPVRDTNILYCRKGLGLGWSIRQLITVPRGASGQEAALLTNIVRSGVWTRGGAVGPAPSSLKRSFL